MLAQQTIFMLRWDESETQRKCVVMRHTTNDFFAEITSTIALNPDNYFVASFCLERPFRSNPESQDRDQAQDQRQEITTGPGYQILVRQNNILLR